MNKGLNASSYVTGLQSRTLHKLQLQQDTQLMLLYSYSTTLVGKHSVTDFVV